MVEMVKAVGDTRLIEVCSAGFCIFRSRRCCQDPWQLYDDELKKVRRRVSFLGGSMGFLVPFIKKEEKRNKWGMGQCMSIPSTGCCFGTWIWWTSRNSLEFHHHEGSLGDTGRLATRWLPNEPWRQELWQERGRKMCAVSHTHKHTRISYIRIW